MRQISAGLAAAQLVRSPRCRVTCTVEARGQNPDAPALAWAELVSNVGQSVFRPTTAVGLANGNILKFVANVGNLQMYTISNPHLAVSWGGVTPVTLVAGTMLSVAAVRAPNTATIRLFFINSSNDVQLIQSLDNGATWSAPSTVYAGGDAVLDMCVAFVSGATDGPWIFGFSVFGGGQYTPRFGYLDGASWVTHAYEVDWRAAGINAASTPTTAARVMVFRARGKGPSRIRRMNKTGAVYSAADDIDQTQAGQFGLEISYARYFHLPEAGACLGVVGEGALGAGIHLGVGGVWLLTGVAICADEPIMLPSVAAVNSQPYACLCSVGADVYLVGDIAVWRGAAQTATDETLTPSRYKYDDHALEIEFEGDLPRLYVGQILVVTRAISWGADSGSESFRAIIVRVEQARGANGAQTKIYALDALGWLGTARCRRPCVVNDGSALGVYEVMVHLAARVGLEVLSDNAALASGLVMPFTVMPGESLAGAAFRVGSQAEYYLLPANDGAFRLTMVTPGTSDSGDYADVAHEYGSFPSEQPIARVSVVSDYRILAFSYVLGTYSTDPEDGAALAMARGPVIDNTRPVSYSLTNSRYNTTTRVGAAAKTEAARQHMLPVTATMEGQANLALEVHDRVEVLDAFFGSSTVEYRVRRIDERWERGRLWQVVYLGDP